MLGILTAIALPALAELPLNDLYEPKASVDIIALASYVKHVPTNVVHLGEIPGIKVEGMRGEWVSFQVLLQTNDEVTGVNLLPENLVLDDHEPRVEIPAEALTLYREWFLNVVEPSGDGWAVTNHERKPGLYPDPLIPFKDPFKPGDVPVAAPFGLGGMEPDFAVVWVDIQVPADAVPGNYTGYMKLVSNEVPYLGMVEIKLTVWELDMPKKRNIGTSYGICEGCIRRYHGGRQESTGPEYDEIVRNYYKVLHEHRMDVTTTRGPVQFQFGEDGNLLPVDWTAYDEFMQPRIDGTYFDDSVGIARFDAGMFAPGHGTNGWTDEQYKQAARAYVEHLDDKGWLDMMWTYSTDEPWLNGGEETWNRVIREAGLLHEASPLWDGHVLVTGPMYPGAEEVVDIWCPVNPMYDKWFWFDMDYAGRGDYDEHIANNGELWFYNCNGNFPPYPGYDIDTTIGYEPRILKWGSWYEKATGFLHWSLNIWYYVEPWIQWQSRDVFGAMFARNGDGMLMYPGNDDGIHFDTEGNPLPTGIPAYLKIDGPVMSYRIKQIRDGLEDWELFIMAEKAGLGDWTRSTMRKVYRRFGDFFVEDCTKEHHYCPRKGEPWTLEYYKMQTVRVLIIKKLLFTLYPDRYTDPEAPEIPDTVETPDTDDTGGPVPDAMLDDVIQPESIGDTFADTLAPDVIVDSSPGRDTPADTVTPGDTEHSSGGGCSQGHGSASPLALILSIGLACLAAVRRRRHIE